MDGDYIGKLDLDGHDHGASFETGLSTGMIYQCSSADNIGLDDRISPSLSYGRKIMLRHSCHNVRDKGQIAITASYCPSCITLIYFRTMDFIVSFFPFSYVF